MVVATERASTASAIYFIFNFCILNETRECFRECASLSTWGFLLILEHTFNSLQSGCSHSRYMPTECDITISRKGLLTILHHCFCTRAQLSTGDSQYESINPALIWYFIFVSARKSKSSIICILQWIIYALSLYQNESKCDVIHTEDLMPFLRKTLIKFVPPRRPRKSTLMTLIRVLLTWPEHTTVRVCDEPTTPTTVAAIKWSFETRAILFQVMLFQSKSNTLF